MPHVIDGQRQHSYCNAVIPLDEVPIEYDFSSGSKYIKGYSSHEFADRVWPTRCEECGAEMQKPTRQISVERMYRRSDTGAEITIREAPAGAMWHADWLADAAGYVGPDGIALVVRLPDGHDWCVDSQASNCTRKQEVPVEGQPRCTRFVRTHYCWCRHGDPRKGELHVDKNGETCAAGAGSIQTPKWHGFLHNNQLVSC